MLKQFFVTLAAFLMIDGLWLTVIAKDFYAKHLGFLMTKTPNLWAALIFYVIYVIALIVFVISPALQKDSLWSAILLGGFFGLCAYATYDLTNLATVKNWPLLITIIDLIWGTFLSASVAGLSFLILSKWR